MLQKNISRTHFYKKIFIIKQILYDFYRSHKTDVQATNIRSQNISKLRLSHNILRLIVRNYTFRLNRSIRGPFSLSVVIFNRTIPVLMTLCPGPFWLLSAHSFYGEFRFVLFQSLIYSAA